MTNNMQYGRFTEIDKNFAEKYYFLLVDSLSLISIPDQIYNTCYDEAVDIFLSAVWDSPYKFHNEAFREQIKSQMSAAVVRHIKAFAEKAGIDYISHQEDLQTQTRSRHFYRKLCV